GGGQLGQVAIVAAGEGKIFKTLGIEELTDAGSGGVDRLDLRVHGHGFGSGSKGHGHVERDGRAYIDHNAFDGSEGETLRLGDQSVFAGGDGLEVIVAGRPSGELSAEAGGGIGQRHFGVGYGGVCSVIDDAVEGAALQGLGEGKDTQN